jgi:hypothetical protein
MKKSFRIGRQRAHGGVAVEFAAFLPVILLLVSGVLFFGRIFWHYTVAEKAAYDAVRFLAAAPAGEFRIQGPGGTESPVVAVARAIVLEEIAELSQGGPYLPVIDVLCDGRTCGGTSVPTRLTVLVTLSIVDPFLDGFTSQFTGGQEVLLYPVARMHYVEN